MRLLALAFLIANALPLFSQKELYLGVDLNPQMLINNQGLYYDIGDGKTKQLILDYGIKVGGILNKKWDLSIGISYQKRKSEEHSVLYPIPDSLIGRWLIPKLYLFEDDQIEGNHLLSTTTGFLNFPVNLKYVIKQKDNYSIFTSIGWVPELAKYGSRTIEPFNTSEDKIISKWKNSNPFLKWKSHSVGIGMYKNWTNIRSRFAINLLSRNFKYNLVRVSGEIGVDYIFLRKK